MAQAAEVYFPDLGPDDLVLCPYDETHIVTMRRFPYHLMKERKNYPRNEMKQCPFNMLHHIPAKEFDYHKVHCPDKDYIIPLIVQEANVKHISAPTSPASVDPPSSENWEEEADAEANLVVEPLIPRREMPSTKSPRPQAVTKDVKSSKFGKTGLVDLPDGRASAHSPSFAAVTAGLNFRPKKEPDISLKPNQGPKYGGAKRGSQVNGVVHASKPSPFSVVSECLYAKKDQVPPSEVSQSAEAENAKKLVKNDIKMEFCSSPFSSVARCLDSNEPKVTAASGGTQHAVHNHSNSVSSPSATLTRPRPLSPAAVPPLPTPPSQTRQPHVTPPNLALSYPYPSILLPNEPQPFTRILRYTPDLYPVMESTRSLASAMNQFSSCLSRIHLCIGLSPATKNTKVITMTTTTTAESGIASLSISEESREQSGEEVDVGHETLVAKRRSLLLPLPEKGLNVNAKPWIPPSQRMNGDSAVGQRRMNEVDNDVDDPFGFRKLRLY